LPEQTVPCHAMTRRTLPRLAWPRVAAARQTKPCHA